MIEEKQPDWNYINNTLYKSMYLLVNAIFPYLLFIPLRWKMMRDVVWFLVLGYGCGILAFDLFTKRTYFSSKVSFYYLTLAILCFLSLIMTHINFFRTAKDSLYAVLGLFLLAQYPLGISRIQKEKQLILLGYLIEGIASVMAIWATCVFLWGITYSVSLPGVQSYIGFNGVYLDILCGFICLSIYMGIFASVALCFLVLGIEKRKSWQYFILQSIMLLLALFVLVLTQSRGSLYFLAIVLCGSIFFLWKLFPQNSLKCYMFFFIIAGVVSLLFVIGSGLLYGQLVKLYGIFSPTAKSYRDSLSRVLQKPFDSTLSGRTTLWKEAVSIIQKYPLWGIGNTSYQNPIIESSPAKNLATRSIYGTAHESYLQMAMQNGLPFAILVSFGLIFLFARNLVTLFRKSEKTRFVVYVLFSLFFAFYCLGFVESFIVQYQTISWFVFMCLCGYFSGRLEDEGKSFVPPKKTL